jgi:hypothetical protein
MALLLNVCDLALGTLLHSDVDDPRLIAADGEAARSEFVFCSVFDRVRN